MSRSFENFFSPRPGCTVQLLLILRLLLVWLLVMENGERLVRHRWRTEFMCLANMNKRGISTHYHLRGLVSTQKLSPGVQTAPATLVMEIGIGLANGEQWSSVNHQETRMPAAPTTVPSPSTGAAGEWRAMEAHDPRYVDYGQWNLRII